MIIETVTCQRPTVNDHLSTTNQHVMHWYLAKIVFRILCGDGQHMAQFDEQLRLVSANDKDEAFHKAQQLGVLEEDTFFNKKDQLVQWKFINVCELYRLSELIDGAALYSRVDEKENAD